MMQGVRIDGHWKDGSGDVIINRSPTSGEVVWTARSASANEVARAVRSARVAFGDWSMRSQDERTEILQQYALALATRKSDIATAISSDMGKPLWESMAEASAMVAKVEISIRALNERPGESELDVGFGALALRHRAHGVMAVFGPFNFPGHLPNGHIVPALLAGNTCVFKPSEQAPSVAAIMADAFEEAGLPGGCLAIVHGARETGAALLNADIDGVLFTGSVETGTSFHRHFAGRPDVILALEMGGNNPIIVDAAQDLDRAADVVFHSAFITSGQRCSCARRLVLIESPDTEPLLRKITERIRSVSIGFWDEEDVFLGPLVSDEAAEAALRFEAGLIASGGEPIVRLERSDRSPALLRPGLIDVSGVEAREDRELFGPLLQVIRVETESAALEEANATRFGLAAGVVSDDPNLWTYYRDRLRAGIVNWNRPTTGASSAMPFGGPGLSGNHRPSAYYAADYCAWPQASQMSNTPPELSAPGYPGAWPRAQT